jgi:hypothetical protein
MVLQLFGFAAEGRVTAIAGPKGTNIPPFTLAREQQPSHISRIAAL